MKKVALITGASAGLGVEFARQLSKRGHRLVLAARRKDRLDALAKELGNARAVAIDLSKADAAAKLMADIAGQRRAVDLLVNNAGFGLIGRFAELDAEARAADDRPQCRRADRPLPRRRAGMIRRKSGGILNVASTAAFQPGPKMAVYFATKAFVLSFTEALHEELKPHGIKCHLPLPGPDPHRIRRRRGLRRQPPFRQGRDGCAGGGRGRPCGARQEQGGRRSRLVNKIGASSTRFAAAPVVRKIAGAIKY